MCDFKIGDIVKCVDCGEYSLIKNGYIYEITGIKKIVDPYEKKGILVRIHHVGSNERCVGGDDWWYCDCRFEKVGPDKDNPFDCFDEILINREKKSISLFKNGCSIKVYNDLTPEGGKRIELYNVVTYHNDKYEITDEKMRKVIECACKIYDMVFT